MHYGLYSLIGKGEWHMHLDRIAPVDYARWKEQFTAERFDADAITDLALASHMRWERANPLLKKQTALPTPGEGAQAR